MRKTALIPLIILFLSAASFAQYSGEYNLNQANVSFTGENAGDMAGYHTSFIGDVNDDGYDDILIAAPYFDVNPDEGIDDNGKVYLIFGKSDGWSNSIDLSSADASFLGEERHNQASHDVFGIGDVNKDGIDDFAIGVKFINQAGTRAGKVYIFFGKKTGWAPDTNLNQADASYLGEGDTAEAAHVNPLGDINGDGYDDIIIGSGFNDENGTDAGKAYILFGKPTNEWGKNISLANADASFIGEMAGDWAGHRVAGVGDVNGDSLDDFLICANGRDIDGTLNRGITYLIYGKTTGWARDVSLSEADASFLGPDIKNLNSGWNICGPGDVNGDGFADMLIGGRGKSRAYLVLGKDSKFTQNEALETVAATTFIGEANNDVFSNDMRTLGDLNADGYDDFIIGAAGNDANGSDAGRSYIFYGRTTWPTEIQSINADAIFTGENEGDNSGWSVAGGGDINNDGADDILIAANKNDDAGVDAGKVYLFLTQPTAFKVLSPNGGEVWHSGTTQKITWVKMSDADQVKIEYSTDNGSTWIVVAENATNTGSYDWLVPDTPSTQCLVRIQNALTGDPMDTSDDVFEISNEATITITAPNGGENWEIGSEQMITWNSAGAGDSVTIELSRDNGATWETLADGIPNSESWTWTVTGPASTTSLVRVTDIDGNPTDASDAVFTISEVPQITVLSPKGGENWFVSSTQDITWSSTNTSGSVKIELSRDNGTTWEILTASTTDTGSWAWTVTGPASDLCLVRISDTSGDASDVSDGTFQIFDRSRITVLAPNGGEEWQIGSQEDITWQGENLQDGVKIELSRDNGTNWETLQESHQNDGTYSWQVTSPQTTAALVRVSEIQVTSKLPLRLTDDHSTPYKTEDWSNAIDNDTEGWDGTVTDTSNPPFAVFAFADGDAKTVNKVRLMTDTGVGYSERWTKKFHIQTSMDASSFETVLTGTMDGGNWQEFTFDAHSAKYVKLIIDEPSGGYRQLGEFEVWGQAQEPAQDVSDQVFTILPPPSITVTAPNGGEDWQVGTEHEITWTANSGTAQVKIELSRDSGANWEQLTDQTENDGSWNWLVAGTPSTTCFVRVSTTDGSLADTSDAVFTISPTPSLTVTAPNGGEDWEIGTEQEVTWTSVNTSSAVKIELSRDKGSTWEQLIEQTDNDGSWNWTIAGAPSTTCLIRISTIDGQLADTSDAAFTISKAPFIQVTFPNGSEKIQIESEQEITWTSNKTSGTVKIELSRDKGSNWETLAESTEDNGAFQWTVTGPASNACLVKVSDSDGAPVDSSDAVFEITEKPVITILVPNGGEDWHLGTEQNITWSSSGNSGNVKIELSRDSGQNWETLVDTTPDTGSWTWEVTGTTSASCLVRVSDIDGDPSDRSDAAFSISEEPTLTLISPNGGEEWLIDSTHVMTWTSVNTSDNVKIELSRNNGTTWETVAEDTENDGSFEWTTTGPASDSCLVRISAIGGTLADVSDSLFSIAEAPVIALQSPNGGEAWEIAGSQVIQWTSVNIGDQVKIELSRDNGSSWEFLSESAENNGEWSWEVAGPASDSCLVRVSSTDGSVSDTSDSLFSIFAAPQLSVSMPNGGETWEIGTNTEISWTSNYTSGILTISLSRDNGAHWETIAEEIHVDQYTINYDVSGPPADSCLIKIIDVVNGVSDVSDAVFTIKYPTGVISKANKIPDAFGLKQNYPNPFNPETKIMFQLPATSQVQISIFNLKGELVRTLVDGTQPAGIFEILWDGRDQSGRVSPSGIYFYKMVAGDFQQVKRMVFMK